MLPDPAKRTAPNATYRLQLKPGFGLDEAAQLVDYLADLGITHLYLSPYLQAAPGSPHGYDVVDHGRINEELGGARGLDRLCEALGRRGLGQVVDVVPNHMSVTCAQNRWWWDILEYGQLSRYAAYFDIDWDSPEPHLRGKVLLPILGDHLARELAAGRIRAARRLGRLVLGVYDRALPLAITSLPSLLQSAAATAGNDVLRGVALRAAGLSSEPGLEPTDRRQALGELHDQLAEALRQEAVAECLDQALAVLSGQPQQLGSLLSQQHYRLAFWRTARDELNYRRFFDINDLASLRMEEEQVFEATHRLIVELVENRKVHGIRVDHPDGLRDPEQYFCRLRAAAPDAWIVAEKILEPGEHLPDSWPIDGTTGYDFLNLVGGLFVDPQAQDRLARVYAEFTGEPVRDFSDLVRDAKCEVLDDLLAADLARLAYRMHAFTTAHREHGDITRQQIHLALKHLVAALPVYRTYLRPGEAPRPKDLQSLELALAQAQRDCGKLESAVFVFLRKLLSGQISHPSACDLIASFQQLTGPAMAKGLEDTAFYRYVCLLSLNEVGGNPARFGVSVDAFHAFCARTQARWPRTMLCSSTHDTKRSEDVRSRISLLSQMPEAWEGLIRRLSQLAGRYQRDGVPSRTTQYLLWQTLVGAWPISTERAVGYLRKAMREAKRDTSWMRPDLQVEQAALDYATRALEHPQIVAELTAFVGRIEGPARVTSLAQLALKLLAPGIPDTYQGTELWDLSLVDPDNRRVVDFAKRRELLAELPGLSCAEAAARADEGLPKLFLLYHALQLRQRRPDCFGVAGEYRALAATGRHADRIVAFTRGGEVIAVVPRLVLGLDQGWADTAITLPSGQFRPAWSDAPLRAGTVPLGALLEQFPVAVMERTTGP